MEHRKHENSGRRRQAGNKPDGPKREAIIDLSKYKGKEVRIQFIGGRLVVGKLKGFDQLMNLVLEDATETLRDPIDETVLTSETRDLGFVVIRGPSLLTISPVDGSEIIDNPFVSQDQ